MKKCLIIGKPNVGKTLFLINFAEYLGYRNIALTKKNSQNTPVNRTLSTKEAREVLSSKNPYMTNSLQSVNLNIPLLKGVQELEFIDTSGIIDGVHNNVVIRKSMAETLSLITQCDILIHMIDITTFNQSISINSEENVDIQLIRYGEAKGGYLMLANKMDLLQKKTELVKIQRAFPNIYIIPVSALTKQGFSEVKAYVSRRI